MFYAESKRPNADGIACPNVVEYNDRITEKEKDASHICEPAPTGSRKHPPKPTVLFGKKPIEGINRSIASDPAGNYICFDYRNGENPKIIFWEHEQAVAHEDISDKDFKNGKLLEMQEQAIFFVANSFSEYYQ
ncbi:SMI1/KNR4 family protein [Paenibacillus plantiphilus]|uniref:SMI1/KNR4 family protein n=1 Tax=Paenibacillus plantiphilus TaxID=2905650 RepID=UPI001F1F125F|nr:SMI1/KNR4 family protein [Paenibacillus plantiphilus]